MEGFGDYDYGDDDKEEKTEDEDYDGDFEGDNSLADEITSDDNDLNRRSFKRQPTVERKPYLPYVTTYSVQEPYVEALDTVQVPHKQSANPAFKPPPKLGSPTEKYPDVIALVDKKYNTKSFSQRRPRRINLPTYRRRRLPRLLSYFPSI